MPCFLHYWMSQRLQHSFPEHVSPKSWVKAGCPSPPPFHNQNSSLRATLLCTNLNMQKGRSSTDDSNQSRGAELAGAMPAVLYRLHAEQSANLRAKKQGCKSLTAHSPLLSSKGHLLMYESTQAGNFLIVTIKFLCSFSAQGYPGHWLLLHLPSKKKKKSISGQAASSERLKTRAQEVNPATLVKDFARGLSPICSAGNMKWGWFATRRINKGRKRVSAAPLGWCCRVWIPLTCTDIQLPGFPPIHSHREMAPVRFPALQTVTRRQGSL